MTISLGVAFPQTALLTKAHVSSTFDATTTPSLTPTSTPTLSVAITNAEKSLFDPILAFLNFAAALLIAFLVFLLVWRFVSLVRITNLVVDSFIDATGDDSFNKMVRGLHQAAREALVDEINKLQKRIQKNMRSLGPSGYQLPTKSPVPEGTTDTQLSDLLKSLKDATSGEISTAVQLMSLVFVPRGTRVSSTLHCLDDKHPKAAFSLEVMDLRGQKEPIMYTIREALDPSQKATTLPLGERYYKMLPIVMRWLAIELARRSMEAQVPRASYKRKHYQAQVSNFIGAFYEASGQSYTEYPFFYQLAVQDFQQAIEYDDQWYQPYENLADTYSFLGQADQANSMDYFNQSLSYYRKTLDHLSYLGRDTSYNQQTKKNIKRRIEIGQATTQARTGNSKLVSEATQKIGQVMQDWKEIDSVKDTDLLYNLACCYAVIGKQSHDVSVVATAKQKAYLYLAYSLVREYLQDDKTGDLWKYAPQDPDFASIHDKLPRLLKALQQKLDEDSHLLHLKDSSIAKEIRNTLQEAQLIS